MQTKTGLIIPPEVNKDYKKFLINMIYKILPTREEGLDWEKYLESLILEIQGFNDLFIEIDGISVVRILSKLNSLKFLNKDKDFYLFRKIIFECTNLIK